MKKNPKAYIVFLVLTSLFPLAAENHFYEINEPIGKIVSALVDELSRSGQPFRVEKVYNPKVDGHEGMLLRFLKSGALCEFLFLPHPVKKNRSKIRVFAQSKIDARWLHSLLTQKLHMKRSDVSNKFSPNTWPVKLPPR